jgi:hypothetical protein
VGLCAVEVDDRDARAFAPEPQRGCATDPMTRACDECDASREPIHRFYPIVNV